MYSALSLNGRAGRGGGGGCAEEVPPNKCIQDEFNECMKVCAMCCQANLHYQNTHTHTHKVKEILYIHMLTVSGHQ